MTDVAHRVSMLEHELRAVFINRLQSLVAYGLKATGGPTAVDGPKTTGLRGRNDAFRGAPHGGHDSGARTQTLGVVDSLTGDDLKACAGHIAAWHDAGLATPLLMASDEFRRSLDAFPLEFGAILADHVVVFGKSPFEGMTVDPADMRRACEVQARSHLLHLREGYLETRGRADALALLIVQSAAPFAALLTSVARLHGLATTDEAAAGRHAERELHVSPGVVTDVVELAHVTEISSADATRIFPAYFDAVERLVKYVDGWSAR